MVTYGDRLPLVKKVILYLETEPNVQHIVLVDNGSRPPIRRDDIVTSKDLRLVVHARNSGSAAGFRAGLAEASSIEGVNYILVLDDDNVCVGGGVASLIDLAGTIEPSRQVIVSALRQDRSEYARLLAMPEREQVVRNSFLGFHVRELYRKLVRRASPRAVVQHDAIRKIRMAPYGGLLLPASLVATVGLPDPSLVLYSDDHEYTLRLSEAGTPIYLTGQVRIQDLDQSWDQKRKITNPWIDAQSDGWRIYYSSRNRVFLERKYFVTNPLLYAFNAISYLTFLAVVSLWTDRSSSNTMMVMGQLWHGVRDGYLGRLGYRAEYTLPNGSDPSELSGDGNR
ncbi:glycosyltransferase [Bradyrhizobium sp. SSUT112]|uniref:glycosyltransferase n=1 Tax=Bradyrhizobium sp. SSUT112 TaxID=3040604 RepID=UPI00244D1A8D|nr:glycosyltransferase [Bradyrhizobium sp. SSUT112]MDH2357120.1 glycosyltransferase [Bradyrhizobium sp. SSUT112]